MRQMGLVSRTLRCARGRRGRRGLSYYAKSRVGQCRLPRRHRRLCLCCHDRLEVLRARPPPTWIFVFLCLKVTGSNGKKGEREKKKKEELAKKKLVSNPLGGESQGEEEARRCGQRGGPCLENTALASQLKRRFVPSHLATAKCLASTASFPGSVH